MQPSGTTLVKEEFLKDCEMRRSFTFYARGGVLLPVDATTSGLPTAKIGAGQPVSLLLFPDTFTKGGER